jgi:hypothetical protein
MNSNEKTQESFSPSFSEKFPNKHDEWPNSRYFQVHFEHLHEVITSLQQEMESQRRLLQKLQRQVERRQKALPSEDCKEFIFYGQSVFQSHDSN